MKNLNEKEVLCPKERPEVVALNGQTIEEVKNLINESNKEQCKSFAQLEEALNELCEPKEEKRKLLYDESSYSCSDLIPCRKSREKLKENVDVFATWRKLADVKVGDEEITPESLPPIKELMDFVIIKLKKSFSNLDFSWNETSWNPSLLINSCETRIDMEKLSLAYKGLLNITDELSAQVILFNIINKKIKELFI